VPGGEYSSGWFKISPPAFGVYEGRRGGGGRGELSVKHRLVGYEKGDLHFGGGSSLTLGPTESPKKRKMKRGSFDVEEKEVGKIS